MFAVNSFILISLFVYCFSSVYLDTNVKIHKNTTHLEDFDDYVDELSLQLKENNANNEFNEESKFIVVCIKDGCLRGNRKFQFDSFLGIPFAKAPLGSRRFANPIPNDLYLEHIRNATEESPKCIQRNIFNKNVTLEGSEDCLYLNVYRPKGVRRNSTFPVMVHIHGGGFFSGGADPTTMGPEYFMQNGKTIMVSMNYRLGVLGFLSTGDENSPGNFALKDQLLALKWVKRNIWHFGGDPNSITLIGQSVGAVSVQMHMMSPASQGYFHRAILQSGSATAPYTYPTKDPLALARRHAEVLGIHDAKNLTNNHLIDNLRKLDAADLVDSVEKLKFWSVEPTTLYRPVIEKDIPGAFLTQDPRVIWQNGNFEAVPWIVTYLKNDGVVIAGNILTNETLMKDLTNRFDDLIPKILEIPIHNEEVLNLILKGIKDFYFNGTNDVSFNTGKGLMNMFNDRLFIVPMYNIILQFLQYSNPKVTPVNIYKFDFKSRFSYANIFGLKNDYGIVHCDDLIYLYRLPLLFKCPLEPNTTEYRMMQIFVETFEYFAKYGVAKKWSDIKPCEKSTKLPAVNKSPQICEYQRFARNKDNNNNNVEVSTIDEFRMDAVDFWRSIDEMTEKRLA